MFTADELRHKEFLRFSRKSEVNAGRQPLPGGADAVAHDWRHDGGGSARGSRRQLGGLSSVTRAAAVRRRSPPVPANFAVVRKRRVDL